MEVEPNEHAVKRAPHKASRTVILIESRHADFDVLLVAMVLTSAALMLAEKFGKGGAAVGAPRRLLACSADGTSGFATSMPPCRGTPLQ